MKILSPGLSFVVFAALVESAFGGGWGRQYAIEVVGDGEPLVITDPAIVDELSFWVGPGTGYRAFMGPAAPDASIVDWERGEVSDRPDGLPRYEVRFLLEPRDNPPTYIVWYEPDPDNDAGYIYYTGKGDNIVSHRARGTWRYASSNWNALVGTRIADYSKH